MGTRQQRRRIKGDQTKCADNGTVETALLLQPTQKLAYAATRQTDRTVVG